MGHIVIVSEELELNLRDAVCASEAISWRKIELLWVGVGIAAVPRAISFRPTFGPATRGSGGRSARSMSETSSGLSGSRPTRKWMPFAAQMLATSCARCSVCEP